MRTEYLRRALNPTNNLPWPIRLRLLLILPGSWKWNAWVRDWTAHLEGYQSYEDEMTEDE